MDWVAALKWVVGVDWSKVTSVVESVVTSLGIIVGSGWLLLRRRDWCPRACAAHSVETIPLCDGRHLVHVETTLSNVGKVPLSLESSYTRLQQIRPLTRDLAERLASSGTLVQAGQKEAPWPTLDQHTCDYAKGQAEIEPGESQSFEDDFVVDSSVEVAEVYSYFRNTSKRRKNIGWNRTTLVQIQKERQQMADRIQEHMSPKPTYEEKQLTPKLPTPPVAPPSVGERPGLPDAKPVVQLPPKTITPPPPPPPKAD